MGGDSTSATVEYRWGHSIISRQGIWKLDTGILRVLWFCWNVFEESVHTFNRTIDTNVPWFDFGIHSIKLLHGNIIILQMPKMRTCLLFVAVNAVIVILSILQRSEAQCAPNSTVNVKRLDFPPGFVFGTASSAFQVKTQLLHLQGSIL